jgi:hypothetical protein
MNDRPSRRALLRGGGLAGGVVVGGWYLLATGKMDIHLQNWMNEPQTVTLHVAGPKGSTVFERTVELTDRVSDVARFEDRIPKTRFPYQRYRAVATLPDGTRTVYDFENRQSHSYLEVEVGEDGDGGTDVFILTL